MPERLEASVVVVGAGPAGIAAACRAAEAGAETLLLDENPSTGGQLWRAGTGKPPREAQIWLDRLRRSGARVEPGMSVWDARVRLLVAERGSDVVEVAWRHLIVATGARELFLPFPGWTLPGVLGIGGLQAMVKSGAVVAGQRVIVAGSGPLILPLAATLSDKGARLITVAEQAPGSAVRSFAAGLWRTPSKWLQAAALRRHFLGTRYRTGVWIAAAAGGGETNDGKVVEVTLTDGTRTWNSPCDLLAASYGLVPNLELARLLGCDLDGSDPTGRVVHVDNEQRASVDGVLCAGEVCGIGGVDSAIAEGQIAGLVAAEQPIDPALLRQRRTARRFAADLQRAFAPRRELLDRMTDETLVCRCEDVPWGAIDPAWSMRQAKLYRRVGMGPCQGRVCGAALEHLCAWEPDTVRPPLKPVTASTLAEGQRGADRAPSP